MAANANPGADATLVNVAYHAAMANTPEDYSKDFERAAESYGRTMKASSEMWGNVAKIGAQIGGEMIANANELAAYSAKGASLNPEDAELLTKEIYAIKDAQSELGLNILGGVFDSRETRQKRAELKIQQQELFADIDSAVESINAGTEAVAAGLFDANLNEQEADMVNAIIKSNLKDKVTERGNMAKLTRDEKTGELMYTMYKEGSTTPFMVNEKPLTMTIKQFNESIANNVDDKGAMLDVFNKYNNKVADRGLKSRTGAYDDQMKQMDLNWLDTQLQSPTDLRRAMRIKFGYDSTSFFDDIQNPSTLSADLYSTLLSVTGGGEELPLSGIAEGIEDADNSGGISQAELRDANNYGILSANILGMKDPEVSTAYFKEYTVKKFEDANKYGHSNKAPVAGKTDTDGKGGKYGGWGAHDWTTKGTKNQEGVYITWKDAESRRNDLDNFRDVGGKHGYYTWNQDLGKNGMYIDELGNEMEMWKVADIEGLTKTGENASNFNPTTKTEQNLEEELTAKGLATPSMMKTAGDNSVSDALNEIFDLTSGREPFIFAPWSASNKQGANYKRADAAGTNDITILKPNKSGTGAFPVLDGNGNQYRFKTGKEFTQSDLDIINKIMEDAGYVSKQEEADDNTTYTG